MSRPFEECLLCTWVMWYLYCSRHRPFSDTSWFLVSCLLEDNDFHCWNSNWTKPLVRTLKNTTKFKIRNRFSLQSLTSELDAYNHTNIPTQLLQLLLPHWSHTSCFHGQFSNLGQCWATLGWWEGNLRCLLFETTEGRPTHRHIHPRFPRHADHWIKQQQCATWLSGCKNCWHRRWKQQHVAMTFEGSSKRIICRLTERVRTEQGLVFPELLDDNHLQHFPENCSDRGASDDFKQWHHKPGICFPPLCPEGFLQFALYLPLSSLGLGTYNPGRSFRWCWLMNWWPDGNRLPFPWSYTNSRCHDCYPSWTWNSVLCIKLKTTKFTRTLFTSTGPVLQRMLPHFKFYYGDMGFPVIAIHRHCCWCWLWNVNSNLLSPRVIWWWKLLESGRAAQFSGLRPRLICNVCVLCLETRQVYNREITA